MGFVASATGGGRILEHNGLEYETRGDGDAVLLIHGSHIAGSFLPFAEFLRDLPS